MKNTRNKFFIFFSGLGAGMFFATGEIKFAVISLLMIAILFIEDE